MHKQGLVQQDPTRFPLFLYQNMFIAWPFFELSPVTKSLEQATKCLHLNVEIVL